MPTLPPPPPPPPPPPQVPPHCRCHFLSAVRPSTEMPPMEGCTEAVERVAGVAGVAGGCLALTQTAFFRQGVWLAAVALVNRAAFSAMVACCCWFRLVKCGCDMRERDTHVAGSGSSGCRRRRSSPNTNAQIPGSQQRYLLVIGCTPWQRRRRHMLPASVSSMWVVAVSGKSHAAGFTATLPTAGNSHAA